MDSNLKTYNSESVVKWYAQLDTISPAEKTVFDKHSDILRKSDMLDIGIGGGRTTAFLKDKCKSYTGIDYSEEFVNLCKNKFPGVSITCCDARDLSPFQSSSFDYVNFSFNGIDYVGLADRIKIFSEIQRVLKPKGIFFFSTHNMKHVSFNKKPWLNRQNSFFVNLKTLIKLLPYQFRKIRNKKKEKFTADYSIINDVAHNYNLMTFYTSPDFLKRQLNELNFSEIQLLTKNGRQVNNSLLDDWIFVTCEKSDV